MTTFRFVPFVPHEEGRATFERCWSTLSSFLLFHLAKGMEHVFLYADADDGSNEAYIGWSHARPCARWMVCGSVGEETWRRAMRLLRPRPWYGAPGDEVAAACHY